MPLVVLTLHAQYAVGQWDGRELEEDEKRYCAKGNGGIT